MENIKKCSACVRPADFKKCNDLRQGYEDAGLHFMGGYACWPTGGSERSEKRRKLFGQHLNMNPIDKKNKYISFVHWHPDVVKQSSSDRWPLSISKEVGDRIGLTNSDRYGEDVKQWYYNVPNFSRQQASTYISVAKAHYTTFLFNEETISHDEDDEDDD
jgi:hypothetical protein